MNNRGRTGGILGLEKETVWFLLLVVWVIVIFIQSLIPAEISSEESGAVLLWVVGTVENLGMSGEELTEHLIRKFAHFLEYTIYGVLLIQNFRNDWYGSGGNWKAGRLRKSKGEQYLPVFFAVFMVPFIDETIQLFVSGRSGQISDVWLDMTGGAFGILLNALGIMLLDRINRSKPRSFRRRRR